MSTRAKWFWLLVSSAVVVYACGRADATQDIGFNLLIIAGLMPFVWLWPSLMAGLLAVGSDDSEGE